MVANSGFSKVFIRTDGSSKIGIGHLTRCIAIADALKEACGIRSEFLLRKGSVKSFISLEKNFPYSVVDEKHQAQDAKCVFYILQKAKAGLILVDSYDLKTAFYDTLKKQSPMFPIFAVDDFGEKKDLQLTGVLSFGLSADKRMYPQELVGQSAVGSEFFPLRKEFQDAIPRRISKKHKVKRALVTMGGADPDNQTSRIIRILKAVDHIEAIDILLGPSFRRTKDVERLAQKDRRCKIYCAPRNVAPLMRKADLAITAAGVTCNELAYLGVPMAVLVTADNQRRTGKAIQDKKCGKFLGYFNDVSDASIHRQIQELIRGPKRLAKYSQNAKKLVDGRGAKRLAKFLESQVLAYHADQYAVGSIKKEYGLSARRTQEHAKVKWGSHEGMMNRFHLGIKRIQWNCVRSWVDIGCGTGAFLNEAGKRMQKKTFCGIDVSPDMIKMARKKGCAGVKTSFRSQNFLDKVKGEPFDLVTCIGVLQKCGVPLKKAVARLAQLVRPGGQVFVTTKNLDWNKFKRGSLKPFRGHHWFRVDEIKDAFADAGLKITKMQGFEPRERGKVCTPSAAHSIYIFAKKERR